MTSYDELAAKLAGDGGKPSPHGGPLTPRALIDTYCQPGMQSGWKTHPREHSTFHAGFCGFDERKGYENGYVWIADLTHSGWEPQHDIGHWPYTAYALWPALAADPRHAIAYYCERDMAVEIFDSSESMVGALVKLRAEDPSA